MMSLVETAANVAVGYIVAAAAQMLVLRLFGPRLPSQVVRTGF